MEVDNADLQHHETDTTQPLKKIRLFSAKEFRKSLLSPEKGAALQKFLELCNDAENHNYVLEYLESGGSCLELFQLLETSSEPASLVLEVVYHVLLQIVSNHAQFHSSAYESCRYFLNTHLALINKMLSLASTSRERIVILKLLTVIVTFSRNLAKDVLLHVSFNPTNLEMLTKQTGEEDSVRNMFIHFLVSFLVEGEYPTISILLDKKGLLTSIIHGLQYDPAKTVCMVMTTFKNNILENTFVFRTSKMNIFSTPVVKDIVNLYNWKGPGGVNSKKKRQTVMVNEVDKARVSEAVHSFLLVLCTSHKFGVIFRDRQLGLGKTTHNSLMYTVLQSLERPWAHSYAGELVTRICVACPDLVKTMWANLKTHLEPRPTVRWLSAAKYATVLVKELGPAEIDFCAKELSMYQLAQVIQFLVAPTPILKTLIPESHTFEKPSIKHHILLVLIEFLKSIQKFTSAAESWLKPQDLRTLKNLLSEHVARNFSNAQSILKDWTKPDDQLGSYTVFSHLEIILELLDLYHNMCPQLLESLSNMNLLSLLKEIQQLATEDVNTTLLQINTVKLFIHFEPSLFTPKSDLFASTFSLILSFYFETKDLNARTTSNLLLRNTEIFEGCLGEIDLWIDGVCDLSSFDADLGQTIVEIVKRTSENIFEYLSEMSKFLESSESQIEQQNFHDILENLSGDISQNSPGFAIKHQNLSPLLFGMLEYLLANQQSKQFKKYFSSILVHLLHFQTSPSLMCSVVLNEKYRDLISKHVASYIRSWGINSSPAVLSKTKIELAQNLSLAFLEGDVDEFLINHQEEIEVHHGQVQNCLNHALFYISYLNAENLSVIHLENCKKVIKFASTKMKPQDVMAKIFGHPRLLQNFSLLNLGKSDSQGLLMVFLMDVVKEFKSFVKDFEQCIKPFREKLVGSLKRVLKKAKSGRKTPKFASLLEIVEVFDLEQQQCLDVLNFCSTLSVSDLDPDCLSFYYKLVVYTLKKFMEQLTELEPLPNEVVSMIALLLTFLNKNPQQLDTSACASTFKSYLMVFTHHLENIDLDLFESILTRSEFCKENSLLAGFLLSKRSDFLDLFMQNLSAVAGKKGLMLSLLEASISIQASDKILGKAYENFEPSILKALQKPQKAGQYFEIYRDVVAELINKFMPQDACRTYVQKVQKFEITETFHMQMLICIFSKVFFSEAKAEVVENQLNNAVSTIVHALNSLFKKKSKAEDDWTKLTEIAGLTNKFFQKIINSESAMKVSFRSLCESDHFQLFCKFVLKFGLPNNVALVRLLKSVAEFVNFEESEAQLLLEMAGSHSEFLEVVLSEHSECKTELLDLVLVLVQRWPSIMQRSHIPVLLASYRATIKPADRIILNLLQMYEKAASKTNFYDFKPFLWGAAAATHYSVRQDIQKALWRQPKMGDILDILQEEWVLNTISNYPLDLGLSATKSLSQDKNVYDLAFLLPLFSSLLAPENEAATYKFAKSGALSLTVVALCSNNRELRLAACHVLARLHYHIEARHDKKSKLLWLRYVEAVCRGTAVLEDFKLNNFAAIFWARMALILTEPLQPLYVPLSQYLGAKIAPDLSGVPELYTFLHGSDVNFKDTRAFILEILRDGLRRDEDFSVALYAMAFKLIMELFSSCEVDFDTKALILNVFVRASHLDLGKKLLCTGYGLLSWLYEVILNLNSDTEVDLASLVMQILSVITKNANNLQFVNCGLISLIVKSVFDKGLMCNSPKFDLEKLLQVILNIFDVNRQVLNEEQLNSIIFLSNSKKCEYLKKYGCKFSVNIKECRNVEDFDQLIVSKWINK